MNGLPVGDEHKRQCSKVYYFFVVGCLTTMLIARKIVTGARITGE